MGYEAECLLQSTTITAEHRISHHADNNGGVLFPVQMDGAQWLLSADQAAPLTVLTCMSCRAPIGEGSPPRVP